MMKEKNPPAILKSILWLFVNAQYLEEIEGDLEELYRERLKTLGRFRANVLYIKDVFQALRPYGVRNSGIRISSSRSPYVFLLSSNLKISFRSLWKRKSFTVMNITGLSIGLTSCILLTLFIIDELSFDKQFVDGDRIHRLSLERKEPQATNVIGAVPHSFTTVIAKDFPEVERTTALCGPFNDMMITYKDARQVNHKFLELDVFAADSNFFKILSFRVLKGNRNTMLQQPRSMVLTESAAKRFFGTVDPMGKTMRMSGDDFIITGVCEDPPANTHFTFNLIISIHTIERFNLQNFNRPNSYCYIKLKPGADAKALELKFPKMVDLYAAAEFEKMNNTPWANHVKAGFDLRYFLWPLPDVYLNPDICDFKPAGNMMVIRLLIGIDILVFLVACINFVNLATARSTERAKEVGVRKVIGSHKINLIFQFLTESFLVTSVAILLAVGFVYLSLPYFNTIAWKDFHLELNATFLIAIGLLIVFVTVMAGLYPAFVLSSFKPIVVLKGKFISSKGGKWIRSGLVVFQFGIASMLILCTMVIYQQMKFINEKDLGYEQQDLLLIAGDFHMKPAFTKTLMVELRELPQVVSCAGSLSMPSDDGVYRQQYRAETMPDIHSFHTMHVGDNYAEVMAFKKVAGTLFSERTNDSLSVIVNEAAVKAFGFDDPIGKTITYVEQTYGTGEQTNFTVIGVVKDFHYASMHQRILPLVIASNEIIFSRASNIVVRLQPGEERQALEAIAIKWKKLAPDSPFEFKFVNHMVDKHYKKERQIETIVTTFSLLSILVACIGLFGLSAYTAASRAREIGIRKVIGASTSTILVLLSKDYTKLIAIAFVMTAPLSWYLMEHWWFEQFAFRTEISLGSFVLIGVSVLIMALLTVGFQSLRAAYTSPVDVINQE